MVDKSRMTRRSALCLIGGGTAVTASGSFETFGFSELSALRQTTVETVDDQDALVGLLVSDTVKKNSRGLLVEVTNNITEDLTVTVSLNDGTQGTLYGPNGDSGEAVAFSLAAATADSTDSAVVEIEANVSGVTIPFTITATTVDSSVSFNGTRETDAVSGNTAGAVEISKVKKFRANTKDNDWTIDQVEVTSNEFELDRVEYEVTDGNDTVVGTRTYKASPNQFTYTRKGNKNDPGVVISPSDGYQLTTGTEYTLTVRAYDEKDNFAIATRSDVA